MCEIMEKMITEEKEELARGEISRGELSLQQIARVLRLPLDVVEKLAEEVKAEAVMA